MSDKNLPLSGVRVLDFSRLLPGPWATQMLGQFGADVIKIEQPQLGDPSRHAQPRYRSQSVYSNAVNGSKRSLTLDLGKEAGQAVAHRLIGRADIVVESFRSGVASKLRMDYQTAKEINPRVIYCSITGFGRTGPLSHVAGHDLLIQAMTGSIYRSVEDGNAAVVPPFQAGDFAGALMACIGIFAALTKRARTGEGCDIDVALLDALFYMCPISLTSAFARAAGESGEPRQEAFGANPRYRMYTSADKRPIAVALLEATAWARFCKNVGRPELADGNESPADRLTVHGPRKQLYEEVLSKYCSSHTATEIQATMEETGIAICPAWTPDEALASENILQRGLVDFIDHPVEGRIPQLVNPLRGAQLCEASHRPAPQLGEHSEEILREIGFAAPEILALRREAII